MDRRLASHPANLTKHFERRHRWLQNIRLRFETPVVREGLLQCAWEREQLAERAMLGCISNLPLKNNKSVHLSDFRYEIAGADCGPAEKWSCHIKACAVHHRSGLKKITCAKSSHTVSKLLLVPCVRAVYMCVCVCV